MDSLHTQSWMHFSGFGASATLAQSTQFLVSFSSVCIGVRAALVSPGKAHTHSAASHQDGLLTYLLLTPSHFTVSSSVGCKDTNSCLSPM